MVVHMVMMKFPDPADARIAADMFQELSATIPFIRKIVVGLNVVPNSHAYDLGMTVEFETVDDLKAYLEHPDHELAAQFTRERRSDAAACDIEVSTKGGDRG